MLVGHELLIIALNGDSVLAEGITHCPATVLNHHRKQLALHTHAFCRSSTRGGICVSFVYILNLLEAQSHYVRKLQLCHYFREPGSIP